MFKKIIIASTMLVFAFSIVPPTVSAAALTSGQVSAIISLMRAFNVEEVIVARVERELTGSASPVAGDPAPAPTSAHVSPVGNVYPPGAIGYDLSFNAVSYPVNPFGFVVLGATAGKAFVHNPRMASQFSWARASSAVAPTIYLNVNAAYGSTATLANMSTPKACDVLFGATTTSALSGGTFPEPTICASYNYGYNTAKDAYAYASNLTYAAVPIWWLDVEEANSWSDNTAVNDATIQGAIDYLNTQGIRVGIYSLQYMWRMIAGSSFVPTQRINGKEVAIPSWYPIGIDTRVGAINACVTKDGLFTGSPLWVVQYVESSIAVDQNVAC